MDNRLSIHFGKDKAKSILFVSKHKIKKDSKTKHHPQKYTNQKTFKGHIFRLHIR